VGTDREDHERPSGWRGDEMAETEEHVEGVEKAERDMQRAADEMSERGEQLGRHIDGAKDTLRSAKDDSSVPTASSDWEDSEPDGNEDSGSGAGFDDPEDLDDDDDDDESYDAVEDEDE
jgi:hypothetical protein